MRIAILMTCHNRVSKTLACLSSIYSNDLSQHGISIFLVDDGSTDGTNKQVSARFPNVKMVTSSGDLYWSRGMNLAWRTALKEGFDAYLWLNDDVVLASNAIEKLTGTLLWHRDNMDDDCIVAGCLADPQTGEYTYGVAMRSSTWHPGRWSMVSPSEVKPVFAESFHGNVVLVPRSVVEKVGIIDATFSHAMGDTDYSHRARKAGIPIAAAPGYLGTCEMNTTTASNLFELMGRTHLPPRDWWIFTRRHSSTLSWPVAFLGPYLRSTSQLSWKCLRRTDRDSL